MEDDQVLRIKALEVALATESGGPDALPVAAASVIAAAETYYKFLSKKPDAPQ